MEGLVCKESKGWCIQLIKAAVLGSPIKHSLSPLLHTIAYTELGLESDYSRIEVKSGELAGFLEICDSSWTGFSLTMPLKEEVLSCSTNISEISKRIRSANTLVRTGDGLSATSTDISGFTHALAANTADARGEVLIIGAGGTARAVAAACDGVATRISVMNRSPSRVEAIANCVQLSELAFISWDDSEIFDKADLIISTTPEGASDSLIDFFPLRPTSLFFDVLYKPWPTKVCAAWAARGGQTIDGLDLLIHQGIDQVAMFSQLSFDRSSMATLMRRHGLKALESST